jgi:hypothetical protein
MQKRIDSALDFHHKLTILFDDCDPFPSDEDRTAARLLKNLPPGKCETARQTANEPEPGCLPFTARKLLAESNPFLSDFFRRFHNRRKESPH